MSATNLVRADWLDVDLARYTLAHLRLIRLAAQQEKVARIFVNPAIKKAFCRDAGTERVWLSKVRPTWGHNYHFHIRLACPVGEASCVDQPLPQDGDGCGKDLADWLTLQDEAMNRPKPPPKNPKPPPPPMTLDDLPAECRAVAVAR